MSTQALIVGEREHATVLVALCFWQSLGLPPLEKLDPGSMTDLLDTAELERLIRRLECHALSDASSCAADMPPQHFVQEPVPPPPVTNRQTSDLDLSELVHVHLPFLGNPARAYSVGNYERVGDARSTTHQARALADAVVEPA